MTTNIRDPRSIVTPDAFSVSEDLLGLPLATPRRRLAAILIDLAVVGVVTAVTRNIEILIWGAIGAFLLHLTFQRRDRSTQVGQITSTVFRASTGCLGLLMLTVVVAVGLSEFVDEDESPDSSSPVVRSERVASQGGAGAPVSPAESVADTLSRAGVVDALAALGTAGDTVEPAPGFRVPREAWVDAVEGRAAELFAAERLDELRSELSEAREDEARIRRELEEARDEARSGLSGLTALGRDLVDQLGSAFGIWSLYFTGTLVLLRGRTVGKLLTGMRVLRLDGRPFTWWTALERSGGYAAGIATGLLGFVQIFWDRNRQCVHDKIVGTVVVMDGKPPVPDAWREAWTESPSSADAQELR